MSQRSGTDLYGGCLVAGIPTATRGDLLHEARALSLAGRIELAEAIWGTIAGDAGVDQLPVPESRRRELDRRLAEMEANPEAGSPWDEVRSRLERRG